MSGDLSENKYKVKADGLYQHNQNSYSKFTPQEIILFLEPNTNLSIICNIRVNSASKYHINIKNGNITLSYIKDGKDISIEINAPTQPVFYDRKIEKYYIKQLAQLLGINALGVIPQNYCNYFSMNLQCKFCEIVCSFVKTKIFDRALKPLHLVADSIKLALELDKSIKYLVITSGNFTQSNNECAQYYIDLLKLIKKELKNHDVYVYASLVPPKDRNLVREMKNVGYNAIAYNLEAWNEDNFKAISPGKATFIMGGLKSALREAVNIFGKGNVFSNTIYGIQSLQGIDGKTYNADRENKLLYECDYGHLELGVIPLHTIYHTIGCNKIGNIQLDLNSLKEFFNQYGMIMNQSDLIPPDREGVLFDLGSISNHPYNDVFILHKYYE